MILCLGEPVTGDLVAVANLGSGCAIETSNLQVGTTELGVLFFGDKYRHITLSVSGCSALRTLLIASMT